MSLIEADAMTRDARLGSDHRPRRGLRARPARQPEHDRKISTALSTLYDPVDVDVFLDLTNNATLDEILALPRDENPGARREVSDD